MEKASIQNDLQILVVLSMAVWYEFLINFTKYCDLKMSFWQPYV